MISFIIPYYNHWELCHQRLAEFYKFILNKYDIEIVLVNDASTETDCVTGVKFWQGVFNGDGNKVLRYHANKENSGFGASMNVGMQLARGRYICLYSNDVVMKGDFVGQLLAKLGENPHSLISGEVISYPAGWNEFQVSNGKNVYFPYANGWMLAFERSLYEKGIYFDIEAYGKYDYEDVDLSTQARELGYNLIALNTPLLQHIGGATIYSLGVNRQEQTQINRQNFIEKWKSKFLQLGIEYGK